MLGVGLVAYLRGLPTFGAADPLGSAPAEDDWHHEGLTRQAAEDTFLGVLGRSVASG
jgi:hypothetical protein